MRHSSFKLLFTAGFVSVTAGLGIYSLTQGDFGRGSTFIAAAIWGFVFPILILLADGPDHAEKD